MQLAVKLPSPSTKPQKRISTADCALLTNNNNYYYYKKKNVNLIIQH